MPIREITEAFTLDDIVPYFQPIIDLHSQGVWRYECLARLITRDDKTFLPSEFLYLLEREHHVNTLAASMFMKCASYFRDVNIPWNINITANDLNNTELLSTLISHLSSSPNHQRVGIEVAASTALSHKSSLLAFADKCMSSGMGVFIDNIGSCPGEISALMDIPLQGVKLTSGLFRHYEEQQTVKAYVENVLTLCQKNNIDVIAEHIEDDNVLARVKRLDVRYAQGYVFSPPKATVAAAKSHH